ncbi:MAG: CPBP family intramembrane glutamic endopeptidase [Salinimicrobium sp.]
MNYIQQAFKAKHEWWRYAIGILVIIAGTAVGQLPFTAALFLEGGYEVLKMTPGEMMRVLESNLSFFLLLLSYAVGLLAVFMVIRLLHNQKILEATTSRTKMDWGRFFFGFGLVAVFTIAGTVIDYNLRPEDFIWNFKVGPFLIMALIAIVMVPLQTSFEEYLFRGYLMQGLGVLSRNRWFPLIVTSFIFGGLHLWNPEVDKMGYTIMVYYIGTGLMLGIMTLMDEGMELALGFHAGNNLVGAMLITADWTAFQTNSILKDVSEPEGGLQIVIPILIVYPLFLFLMAKTYRWKDWGKKLFGKVNPPETIKFPEEI